MKKRLIIIISITIAIILFLLLLYYVIFFINNNYIHNSIKDQSYNNMNNISSDDNIANDDILTTDNEEEYYFESILNNEDYFILKSCINKYYLITAGYSNNQNQEDKDIYMENMYSILNKDYLEKNNIFENDVKSLMFNSNEYYINIEDILFFRDIDKNMYAYVVRIDLREYTTNHITINNMIIIQDRNTNSFSILPNEYIKDFDYNNIKENEKIFFHFPESIERNEFNMFGRYQADQSEFADELIKQLKEFLLYNPQKAYELLDEDFKNNNFKTYDEFKNYIEINRNIILNLTSNNYFMEYVDDYSIYKFKNNKNETFVIELVTKDIMEYKYTFL